MTSPLQSTLIRLREPIYALCKNLNPSGEGFHDQAARLSNLNAMGLKAKIIEHYSRLDSPSKQEACIDNSLLAAAEC